jgi:hypothetical protein
LVRQGLEVFPAPVAKAVAAVEWPVQEGEAMASARPLPIVPRSTLNALRLSVSTMFVARQTRKQVPFANLVRPAYVTAMARACNASFRSIV